MDIYRLLVLLSFEDLSGRAWHLFPLSVCWTWLPSYLQGTEGRAVWRGMQGGTEGGGKGRFPSMPSSPSGPLVSIKNRDVREWGRKGNILVVQERGLLRIEKEHLGKKRHDGQVQHGSTFRDLARAFNAFLAQWTLECGRLWIQQHDFLSPFFAGFWTSDLISLKLGLLIYIRNKSYIELYVDFSHY